MGLFDNLMGSASDAADVLGKGSDAAANDSFNRDFNAGDFDSFGGDTQPGKEVQIAEFTIPASTEYAWGYGSASNPENQGYLYVDLQDSTPSEVEGTIILAQETPTGRGKRVVAEYDTTRLDASKSDRTQQVPLPEQVNHPKVTQDSKLTIYFDANSSTTVTEADSEVIFPVTEYDLGA